MTVLVCDSLFGRTGPPRVATGAHRANAVCVITACAYFIFSSLWGLTFFVCRFMDVLKQRYMLTVFPLA